MGPTIQKKYQNADVQLLSTIDDAPYKIMGYTDILNSEDIKYPLESMYTLNKNIDLFTYKF